MSQEANAAGDPPPPGDDEEDDFEEVSDEEKVAIATHFLLSSPPGQIHDVLADVRNMVPAHLLGGDMLQRVFRGKVGHEGYH